MTYTKRLIFTLFAYLLCMLNVQAQSSNSQKLILEFVSGTDLDIITSNSTVYSYKTGSVLEGDSVELGSIIRTGKNTTAELKLIPNGSVIKIAPDTSLKVTRLANQSNAQNNFTLISGKLRFIAAKGGQYSVYTSDTVAGVRGTDFIMQYKQGQVAAIYVLEGSITFGSIDDKAGIVVSEGQFANYYTGPVAMPFSEAQKKEIKTDLENIQGAKASDSSKESTLPNFSNTKPFPQLTSTATESQAVSSAIPRSNVEQEQKPIVYVAPKTVTLESVAEPEIKKDSTKAESSVPIVKAETPPKQEVPVVTEPKKEVPVAAEPKKDAPIAAKPKPVVPEKDAVAVVEKDDEDPEKKEDEAEEKKDEKKDSNFHFAINAGTISAGGNTWIKGSFEPYFVIDKFSMAFNISIITKSNIFSPSSWGTTTANNEWSFGIDHEWKNGKWPTALLDLTHDLLLKIKYMKYGVSTDPFYFALGDISNVTLGHGLLVNNYTNVNDFNTVRNLGLTIGTDLKFFGLEVLTNDVILNEILAARMFFRPSSSYAMAIGLSTALDRNLSAMLNLSNNPNKFGEPMLIGMGADFDFPIVSSDNFGLKIFLDGSVIIPHVKTAFTHNGYTAKAGFRTDMVYQNKVFKNWATSIGISGKASGFGFKVEARYFESIIPPAYFDAAYSSRRNAIINKFVPYLTGETPISNILPVIGPYIEFSGSFIENKLTFDIGYFWPMTIKSGFKIDIMSTSDDYIKFNFAMKRGLIPVVNLYGSFGYERRGLVQSIKNKTFAFFDENSRLYGELALAIPGVGFLDIAATISASVARNSDGSVVYRSDAPTRPRILPTIGVELRIQF